MERSTSVGLAVLLPDVPGERDACVGRLTESLTSHRGISQVHVVADADTSEPRVCIHYDPGLVSLADVQRMATRAGADVASKDPSASQSESGCCVRILPDPASYISSLAYMTDTDCGR